MAHTQTTMTNALLENARGTNSLVNDLARRRMYDIAVDEFNARDRRPKINFSRAISEEQTLIATEAYPEFQITFYNTQNSVHSLAGGLRNLELEYMMMQIPYGSFTYDIGGNFASHLFKGRAYVHCCMPNLDLRDIMRHNGQNDSVEMYVNRMQEKGKALPAFQKVAFDRYANNPEDVLCRDKFQECKHSKDSMHGGKTYAVALHSLYDIPADELGPALLKKDVNVCFAAFHFSEELLLENSSVTLDDIGGLFTREGDVLHFSFANEPTLNYTHSYSNILKYVCKTFFPASSSIVYMKEFLVTRVNTWFCKFSKVDTLYLHKSIKSVGCDSDQFASAMEDAWQYKKTLAMMNTERIMLNDSASVNFWFPKMRDLVIVPLFDISIDTGKRSRKEVYVNKDFVYTVLNHIRTYQAKALTYANVLSFVESIRSRVIVNGVTARSEWDVDKALLQDLAMTFFLQTKLSSLKTDLLTEKFKVGKKSLSEHVWDEISTSVGNLFPTLKERLLRRKVITSSAQALEIKVPDLYITFKDRFVSEYHRSVEMPNVDICGALEETQSLYSALSELSVLKDSTSFDVDKFSRMCKVLEVDPHLAAKVVVAVLSNDSGVTLTFEKPTEENVAKVLAASPHEPREEEIVFKTDTTSYIDNRIIAEERVIPVSGLTGGTSQEIVEVKEDVVSLSDYHNASVESIVKKQMVSMVYTGSLKVQQMKNYMDSLSASLSAAVSNLRKVLRDSIYGDATDGKYGVYDVLKKVWLMKPIRKGHAWGVVEENNGKMKVVLLEYADGNIVCGSNWRKIAVSTESVVYSDMAKLQTLRGVLKDGEVQVSSAKVVLVDGVPGCGKTKEILQRVNFDEDLVLVPGKEAAEMIRRRANASGIVVATKDNVKTVDSFLMNYGKRIGRQTKNLYIDEGLMLHTGCVNFLVLLSLCEKAYVFGDTQQIPFINRVQNFPYPEHFSKLEVDEVETRRCTLRCPADVTFFLNQRYSGQVTTQSPVSRSVSTELLQGSASLNPITKPLEGKVIVFTQNDKHFLEERGYRNVNTVHEVQGETFENVSIVRVTPTPLSIVARDSPHVLVALSRHTLSCKYYTVVLDALSSVVNDLSKISNYLLDMYKVESGVQ
ncbi:126 kDa replicase [Brugmansia latent virus]|nr:126 kDa replicase [Brugmansia latent virus]